MKISIVYKFEIINSKYMTKMKRKVVVYYLAVHKAVVVE